MSRTTILRVGVVFLAALLFAHAALQGFGAAEFWQPCGELGATSDACSYLQYEAPVPWWTHLAWLWLVEVAGLITILTAAAREGTRGTSEGGQAGGPRLNSTLIAVALVLVVVCNTVIDYVVTPAFNGGHTSADSPPGHGIFGAVGIGLAGIAVLLSLVPLPRSLGGRRGVEVQSDSAHAAP